jgi:hypothetical protein
MRDMWSQRGTSAVNDIKNALEEVIYDYTETLVSAHIKVNVLQHRIPTVLTALV